MSLHSVVANITSVTIDSNGTHLNFQAAYSDKQGNSTTHNLGPVSIGVTESLTNEALGTAVANDCNSTFGTTYTFVNVLLFGGVVFL